METPLSVLLKDKGHAIHSISPNTSVYDCALKLHKLKLGALLVLDDKQELIGIISERDVLGKIVAAGKDPNSVLVETIMTKNLITVLPTVTVREAMRIMTENRVRHLPVVENKKLMGMISIGDLMRWAMMLQEAQISTLRNYIQGER